MGLRPGRGSREPVSDVATILGARLATPCSEGSPHSLVRWHLPRGKLWPKSLLCAVDEERPCARWFADTGLHPVPRLRRDRRPVESENPPDPGKLPARPEGLGGPPGHPRRTVVAETLTAPRRAGLGSTHCRIHHENFSGMTVTTVDGRGRRYCAAIPRAKVATPGRCDRSAGDGCRLSGGDWCSGRCHELSCPAGAASRG